MPASNPTRSSHPTARNDLATTLYPFDCLCPFDLVVPWLYWTNEKNNLTSCVLQ